MNDTLLDLVGGLLVLLSCDDPFDEVFDVENGDFLNLLSFMNFSLCVPFCTGLLVYNVFGGD